MKRQDLETALAFASKDPGHTSLHGVRVEPGRLIACDAHRLVVVHEGLDPKPPTEGEGCPTILRESVERIIRAASKTDLIDIGENGTATVGGMTLGTEQSTNPFPQYLRVLPKRESAAVVVRLDAKYLKSIADAAIKTHEGKTPHVDLYIQGEELAVRFEGDRIEGCIMPMRRQP